jgi:polyphenol oxidase
MRDGSGVIEARLADGAGAWFTSAAIDGVAAANLAHHRPHIPNELARTRQRVAELTSTSADDWHLMRQVHGAEVGIVTSATPPGAELRDVDVIVTDVADRALVVLTADCLPILAAGRAAVGAAHAGWRGLAVDVPGALVAALEGLGERPADIRVVIGPAIGPCCYAVGPEVIAALAPLGDVAPARTRSGEPSVDLRVVARSRLAALGVRDVRDVCDVDRTVATTSCTACDPRWFSHRRDPGCGRQAGIVVRRGPHALVRGSR